MLQEMDLLAQINL